MSVATRTASRTFTQTATHLASAITSSLAETLLAIGISPSQVEHVHGYERAIAAWIDEQTLGKVLVEIRGPNGMPTRYYTWEIDYYAVDTSQAFRDQLARLRRQLAKEPQVPPWSTFEVTAVPRPGRTLSEQTGWSWRTTALTNLSGGHRHGTAASGPGASATLRSYPGN